MSNNVFKTTPAAMISFRPAEDLASAAELTLSNMQPYYQQHAVAWDKTQIEQMTQQLVNLDILLAGKPVGIIRLSFDTEGCYLRDLQVAAQYQNRGIGALALAEAERLAKAANAAVLKLRVFKNSPAVHLYQRYGFNLINADERFYYMHRAVC